MAEWVAVQLGSCFSKVCSPTGLAQTWPIKATSGPRKGDVFVLGIQSGLGEVNSAPPEAFFWSAAKLYCTYLKVREKQKQDYIFLFLLMYILLMYKDILLMSLYDPPPNTHTPKSQKIGSWLSLPPSTCDSLTFLVPCLGYSFPICKMIRLNWMLSKLSFNSQILF